MAEGREVGSLFVEIVALCGGHIRGKAIGKLGLVDLYPSEGSRTALRAIGPLAELTTWAQLASKSPDCIIVLHVCIRIVQYYY